MAEESNGLSSLQQLAQKISDEEDKGLGTLIDSLCDDIIPTKTVMPAYVFEARYLPAFKAASKEGLDKAVAAEWANIAGNPYAEVDIVNDDGKVITTTPGLYSKPETNFEATTKINYGKLASEYNLYANRFPGEGKLYLATQLSPIQGQVKSSAKVDAAKWQEVFNTFDKPKEDETKSNQPVTFTDEIPLSYDD